ncbi:hypothetical protein Tco_0915178, partial [Tanacetum coccineum]
MEVYTLYSRKDTFTPLTKTPKEIVTVESISFLEPPPLIETPEKQNLNKFCNYHGDRGHNTNDCYQLKKQIEEAVASGKLAHLDSDDRFFRGNISSLRSNRSSSNFGKGRKKQDGANGVCNNKMSFAVQHHNRKDQNEKPRISGEVFVWTKSERTTVPRFIMEYQLKIYPLAKPVVHKRRSLASEGRLALKERVFHWLKEGLIRKDMYPLPKEGEGLASLVVYMYKCFLRLPKEYNQIRMAEGDEEKTRFHMEERVYCFTYMPKELKKLRFYALEDDGKCLSQSKRTERGNIRGRNNNKQNKGMKVSRPYGNKRRTKGRSRKNTAISKFISKLAELKHPIHEARTRMEKAKESGWTNVAEEALRKIKRKLSKLQKLAIPKEGEDLLLCLQQRNETISSVLLVTDISQKDKNKAKKDKTRARDWKSVGKTKPR